MNDAAVYSVRSFDITEALNMFLDLFVECFKFCFDFLRNFSFMGTNLLSFTITVFLLGIVFPIIFSLVQSRSVIAANAANESLNKIKSRRSRSSSSSTELTIINK